MANNPINKERDFNAEKTKNILFWLKIGRNMVPDVFYVDSTLIQRKTFFENCILTIIYTILNLTSFDRPFEDLQEKVNCH